tara:strand:- start:6907 stop:7302 length:396 start_codon:yes stop_codon:yes gene_type:complete
MMPKKKPYYPNNWQAIKDAPHQFFIPLPFDEFMEWKMMGWELPSSVDCIIREQNIKTGKVKEYVYSRTSSAKKRAVKIMNKGDSEFITCTHDDLAHMFPKMLTKEDSIYDENNQEPDIFLDDRFGNIEEDD